MFTLSRSLICTISFLARLSVSAEAAWTFVQNGTTGIIGLELMVVSPTLAIMFDNGGNAPLRINGHPAWGALWNMETNRASPLDLKTNGFCASGGFLSNGSMVSVGGGFVNPGDNVPDEDGLTSIRVFEPCTAPDGRNCTIFDNPTVLHLAESRWYPTAIRIFDGSLMIMGGASAGMPFFNTRPVNNFEFFPPKDRGIPRPSSLLARTVPVNMFPRSFALPNGKVFIISDSQTALYDIEANTETPLPSIPNSVRIANPYDGAATLLPLSPPHYIPEVLVCGGSTARENSRPSKLSTQDPASNQCSRIVLNTEGIARGWQVERMAEGRTLSEMVLLPGGEVLIINGAATGYSAIGSVGDQVVGSSNADHPHLTPSLYRPSAPSGQRFTSQDMPRSSIPRLYHSAVTLTPKGNILVTGSNPNWLIDNTTFFKSELRAEYLNPPYMVVDRPVLRNVPTKLGYNQTLSVAITIPIELDVSRVQVTLMDLGFSSHSFHSSDRLVFMTAEVSSSRTMLSFLTPPNNRVYPPGPGWVFVTVAGVTSEGVQVMVGSGASPPVPNQGVLM